MSNDRHSLGSEEWHVPQSGSMEWKRERLAITGGGGRICEVALTRRAGKRAIRRAYAIKEVPRMIRVLHACSEFLDDFADGAPDSGVGLQAGRLKARVDTALRCAKELSLAGRETPGVGS